MKHLTILLFLASALLARAADVTFNGNNPPNASIEYFVQTSTDGVAWTEVGKGTGTSVLNVAPYVGTIAIPDPSIGTYSLRVGVRFTPDKVVVGYSETIKFKVQPNTPSTVTIKGKDVTITITGTDITVTP